MNRRIRVLIADDHPLFREGLRSSLGSHLECELVGEAVDGEEVVEAAMRLRPDVVLMDLHMPVCDGVTATRRIQQADPSINVLVVTMDEGDASLLAAIRAGARGYLVKGDTADAVWRSIVAVAHGEVILGAVVANRLAELLDPAARLQPSITFPDLTERERETLRLIGRGLRNAQIAAQLHVSPKTVRNYVTRILAKLMVTSRTEAVILARDAGLL